MTAPVASPLTSIERSGRDSSAGFGVEFIYGWYKYAQSERYTNQMSKETPVKNVAELLDIFGPRLEKMSVSEVANETGKSERTIRAHLTRHGITIKDHDGAGRKAQVNKAVEPLNTKVDTNSLSSATRLPSAHSNYAAIEKEDRQLWGTTSILFAIAWIVMTLWGFSENGPAFFLIWLVLSAVLIAAWGMISSFIGDATESKKISEMSDEQRKAYVELKTKIQSEQQRNVYASMHTSTYGDMNVNLVCPHCQTKGKVRSKSSEEITRTKVVPIVGNTIKARKKVTQMHCDNCSTTWNV